MLWTGKRGESADRGVAAKSSSLKDDSTKETTFQQTDIAKLLAKLDCYESCIEQLKRETPKYITAQSSIDKQMSAVAKVIRHVASLEENINLRSSLFLCAQKYENIEKNSLIYTRCSDHISTILADSKELMISPLRELTADVQTGRKIYQKQQLAATNDSTNSTQAYNEEALCLHAQLFERHRVRSIKDLLASLLHSEITYHCKAIEELTDVLDTLASIDDQAAAIMQR